MLMVAAHLDANARHVWFSRPEMPARCRIVEFFKFDFLDGADGQRSRVRVAALNQHFVGRYGKVLVQEGHAEARQAIAPAQDIGDFTHAFEVVRSDRSDLRNVWQAGKLQ